MNVDIIVATYKRYELLQETLDSVAKQSYPHWKCWIAEDGESKETYEAVKSFLKDDRFVYLPGMHAGFPAVPRNRAIKNGNSQLIAILDDDDLWLPDKLEFQIDFLKNHSECVILGSNAYFWDGKGNWDKAPLYFKRERLGKINYYKLLKQNYLIHSSLIFRRKAVEQAGLYNVRLDPPIGEDYELCLRVGALGEIWSLPDPYVIYRQTPATFYKKLNRNESYKAAAGVYESALNGVDNVTSPLSYPENVNLAAACRRKRDYYQAGPGVLGKIRHNLQAKVKLFKKK